MLIRMNLPRILGSKEKKITSICHSEEMEMTNLIKSGSATVLPQCQEKKSPKLAHRDRDSEQLPSLFLKYIMRMMMRELKNCDGELNKFKLFGLLDSIYCLL